MVIAISRPVFAVAIVIAITAASQSDAKQSQTTQLPKVVVTSEKDSAVDGYKANASRSSTRTDTKLINTPQAVSVVTQQQIRDQNISSMEDDARYVPGVIVQQGEGNRDQLSIRGNNTSADFFVDGARDDAQYYRDFYNIENIEFLKGPNAMAFGRGGSGGVVNRVSKIADDNKHRQLVLSGGSFNNRRFQSDLGDKVNDKLSLRLNAMYEKSGTFRQFGDIERVGFNPTATIALDAATSLNFGYEFFRDKRFNDRGIPSQNGVAYVTKPKTYFGNPNENVSDSETHAVHSTINHDFSSTLQLKNLTRFSKLSKFYQNVYANGSVNSSGNFNLAAYNDTTERNSLTNQTDLTKKFRIGQTKHTALLGTEITYQHNRILRNTGFFNNSSTSQSVAASSSLNYTPVTYRQSSSDRDGASNLTVYALYTQDQIEINKHLQLIGGLRYDRFEMDYRNNRDLKNYKRTDGLVSPRLGVVLKPQENLSLYTSYSVSYLPSSGDQFTTLSAGTAILKPEKMENYEVGAKWDVNSRLNFSASLYELTRGNSPISDPNNTGFFFLSGESRTRGIELEATGKITNKWQVITGYSLQNAEIISNLSTTSVAGNRVGLVPKNRFSLWSKHDFDTKFSAAIGVISQSDQFAGSDNTVRLKGFTRFDAGVYYKLDSKHRLQANIENLFDTGYIQTAHNNNNIQPGSTRAVKVSLVTEF